MDVGTQFECHRIKVEAKSLLLRSPSFPRVGPLSLSLQGSRAFVSRANEGDRCGSPCQVCRPSSLAISVPLTKHTRLQERPAVPDDPCPPNLVPPMLYVAAAAVTDVVHTSRRLY